MKKSLTSKSQAVCRVFYTESIHEFIDFRAIFVVSNLDIYGRVSLITHQKQTYGDYGI